MSSTSVFTNLPLQTGDNKVKVSSNDTTQDYLEDKLVAGTNITLVTDNDGANETITISATAGGGGITNLDGGTADPVASFGAVAISPIDGGDST